MPAPSVERMVENLRRTLQASIPHYAGLSPDARHADVEQEIVELAMLLGLDWFGDGSPAAYRAGRQRMCTLLDSLVEAARSDQQATYQQRVSKMMAGEGDGKALPPVTVAVDRWLERWLSGKEAGRLP